MRWQGLVCKSAHEGLDRHHIRCIDGVGHAERQAERQAVKCDRQALLQVAGRLKSKLLWTDPDKLTFS